MPPDFGFWLQVGIQTLTLFVMIVGVLGLIVPIFPGLTVVWAAALFYGLLANAFGVKGWILFALITLLMLIGGVVDNILIGAKVRESGAAWLSIWISYAAGLIGSLFFTPLIGLICAPAALWGAEYLRRKDAPAALKTVRAMLIGWGWAFGIRFIIGVTMTGLWMIWAWT